MNLLNKKILVLGLANKHSIAWGIIKALKAQGAEIGICYFNASNYKRVIPLAKEINCTFVQEVDVTKEEDLKNLAITISQTWGRFDGFVHSIAFAPSSAMEVRFHLTTWEDFLLSLNTSSYSLLAITRHLKEFFSAQFSIVSMTYYGSTKVLPGYNVMGIAKATLESIVRYLAEDLGREGVRVNCISSGPIKTLAALGVPDFSNFLEEIEQHSPLRSNIRIDDVGNMAAFLMADESKMITGQILFVDSGMSIIAR